MTSSRKIKVLAALAVLILAPIAYFGYQKMTSIYKTDFGNGAVIYADKYVQSGQCAYDCKTTRLVSREPIPFPVVVLEAKGKLDISTSGLFGADADVGKAVSRAITEKDNWYGALAYLYSSLNEYSDLNGHYFGMVTEYAGATWAVTVRQNDDFEGGSKFTISAKPYNPADYIDHRKALTLAEASCQG